MALFDIRLTVPFISANLILSLNIIYLLLKQSSLDNFSIKIAALFGESFDETVLCL